MSIKIAILASGSGTNAENIINYFRNHPSIETALVVSNRRDAYVLERAKKGAVPYEIIEKKNFDKEEQVLSLLKSYGINFIVLAGFLLKVPEYLIEAYPDKIINIHPALLPKFGGKGMYGDRVHKAVLETGEKETGITIHYINDRYDEGDIIFQAACPVYLTDSPYEIAERVHKLEYTYYPAVIEQVILSANKKS